MRNTLHILFTVVLAVMMCVTGFALTLDTAESAEEATVIPEESAALAATYAPGLNVITGTADVVTFDEENAADYAATFTVDNYDSKEIADIPDALDADGSLGNGLAFYHAKFDTVGDEIWHTIKQSWNSPDGKRKFLYKAKVAYYVGDGSAELAAELTNTWSALQYMYDKSGGEAHHSVGAGKNTWNNWNIGAIPKSGYSFDYRHRVGTSAGASNNTGACKYDLYTYIDNFGIYPYYMINYNVDGEITTEQVLLDADGNIMTVYVPSSENYPANSVDENGNNIECIGWSTVEGATEPMTSVTLANADITLYPVWAQIGIIDSDVDWIAGAKDADTGVYASATVSATEGYTIDSWTVDVGNTKAEFIEDGNSVVITAAGYPGVVMVTAKSGELTATKEIRIVGRDTGNFIIGVDIISGTDKGWTFDNTAEENALIGYFSRAGDTVSGFATEADGNTYVNLGWQLSGGDNSGQYYPQFVIYGYPKDTIGDRPLQFKADAMGSKNNFWLLNFGTLNISSGFKNSSAWTTSKYKITAVGTSATFNCQIGLNETQGAYKLDNISVTPYYKVTYYDFEANEVATEWVLPEDGIYIPDVSKVEGATGYATELGGEAVASVILASEDIYLYAVNDAIVNFVAGETSETVKLEDVTSYTIPTIEALGLEVANFRVWTDGTNFYNPGEVIEDASTLVGKTLKAVCFEEKLFDPAKGDLIYLFNFEGVTDKNTNTFLNMDYATGTASRWDGSSASVISDTDGNSVLKVVNNTTSAYSLFGYAINYNEATIGSKITVQYDYKYMSSIDVYKNNGSASAFMRLTNTNVGATNDKYKSGSMSLDWASKVEDTWYKMSVSATDTAGEGWKGGIVQYQGLSTSAENTLYADNYAMYIYPAKTFVLLSEEGSDEYTKVVAEGDTYVMPASDAANAIAWTDGANYYKFGETYNVSDIQFKALYPFIQDASQPAVIFKYEGNIGVNGKEVVQTNGSAKYGEVIVDDGRDVLHLHAWNKSAQKDYRLILKSGDAAQYDVNEYKYFQFMYKTNNVQKVDDTVSAGYSADSSWNTCVYANYNGNGGFYTKVGEKTILYQFNKNGITEATGNEYIIFEKDLSTISTTEGYPIGYGFTIDPVNTGTTRFGHDIYIDYVRVYRSGITTVTYDTNAPEGATIVTEVDPDTNRGVGTGYLLKGLRPVVEGYKFMGWALTPDAAAKDVIDSFDLTGDTTVYAVWATDETYVAPEDTAEVSIRGSGTDNGLRFKATIMNSDKSNLDEFGFIATREALLPTVEGVADTSALNFNFKKNGASTDAEAPLYATGVAYDKDGDIDMVNGAEADGSIIYTAVATGIPLEAKNEAIIMRTYAKYAFGDTYMVIYGNAMRGTLYDAAKAIADEAGEDYNNNKAYIDSILAETAE